jgi:hypothetical protein
LHQKKVFVRATFFGPFRTQQARIRLIFERLEADPRHQIAFWFYPSTNEYNDSTFSEKRKILGLQKVDFHFDCLGP